MVVVESQEFYGDNTNQNEYDCDDNNRNNRTSRIKKKRFVYASTTTTSSSKSYRIRESSLPRAKAEPELSKRPVIDDSSLRKVNSRAQRTTTATLMTDNKRTVSHGDLAEQQQAANRQQASQYETNKSRQANKLQMDNKKQRKQEANSTTNEFNQLGSQQEQNRQKNVHHYDYYTDSDLTSSPLLFATNISSRHLNEGSNGVENVLLFATEHNNNYQQPRAQHSAVNYSQPVDIAPSLKPTTNNYYATYGQQQQHNNNYHSSNHNHATPTGRFVNYYPSWRQSPTSNNQHTLGHQQNYSFHVPLHWSSSSAAKLATSGARPQRQQSQQQLYQARYGFVAPADRISVKGADGALTGNFNHSFRSRTIAHIPNMLKMSSALDSAHDEAFVVSEGDLLKPTLDIKKTTLFEDVGYDNPFKPNTELSWEADMMVRLMKRGYPIQELPILVETAKQVAIEKEEECSPMKKIPKSKSASFLSKYHLEGRAPSGGGVGELLKQLSTEDSPNESEGKKLIDDEPKKQPNLKRQTSNSELSSGKKVWASSLSRTKSMPRFNNNNDADSIDQLITSIEKEMSELLTGKGEQEASSRQEESSRKSSSPKQAAAKIIPTAAVLLGANSKANYSQNKANKQRPRKQSNDRNDRKQQVASVQAINSKPASKKTLNNSARNKPDLIKANNKSRSNKRKKKERNNGCCVIQ